MSDPFPGPPPARFGWLRPAWFLTGFALGLAALAWLGREAAHRDYHPDFARIYPAISPETSYYPTLNEMIAIVRARCRPGQVLVIVGGNSILQGVWQPVDDLWSKHLQERLGGGFCVLNFAFRGASPTDGGAVVAEALRREFPRQIYIANDAPLTAMDPFGHEPYRYVFWQAYFRGWLLDAPARDAAIRQYRTDPESRRAWISTAISVYFDRALHYQDFWNRVCFEWLCTIPSRFGPAIPALLTPRRKIPDAEPDATDPVWRARRYDAGNLEQEMLITRNATGLLYHRAADGRWELPPATRAGLARNLGDAFPAPLKPRTLILVSRSSPYYLRQLSPDELAREDQGFRDAVRVWADAGCPAMEYGRDFTEDDYGDRIHLSKLGGAKLAEAVAPRVRVLAEKLGYLK